MHTDEQTLTDWIVGNLNLDTTLFHLGQYCGEWEASTSGKAGASFHLILHGRCYLHLAGQLPIPLAAGDSVFLLQDLPHKLTPDSRPCLGRKQPMDAMTPLREDGTGLACGFFRFQGESGKLLLSALPSHLIFRAGSEASARARPVFELILAESQGSAHPAPQLIERLTELLFIFLIRGALDQNDFDSGLLALARHSRFSSLLRELLENPGEHWTLERMAQRSHLSRAAFCRQFTQLCGVSPAQFLQSLRMGMAARQLRQGMRVDEVAEQVGYQSISAFTRAFQRTLGESPGQYRRLPSRAIKTNEQETATH